MLWQTKLFRYLWNELHYCPLAELAWCLLGQVGNSCIVEFGAVCSVSFLSEVWPIKSPCKFSAWYENQIYLQSLVQNSIQITVITLVMKRSNCVPLSLIIWTVTNTFCAKKTQNLIFQIKIHSSSFREFHQTWMYFVFSFSLFLLGGFVLFQLIHSQGAVAKQCQEGAELILAHTVSDSSFRSSLKKMKVFFSFFIRNSFGRHGNRNIIETYPKDPWKSEAHWPGGYGELSNVRFRGKWKFGNSSFLFRLNRSFFIASDWKTATLRTGPIFAKAICKASSWWQILSE